MAVSDDKKRAFFEKAAARNAWSVPELAARIKQERPADAEFRATGPKRRETSPSFLARGPERKAKDNELLTPLRGTLYTYRLVKRPQVALEKESGLLLDLGFGDFRSVDPRLVSALREGDIVESRPKEDAYKFYKGARTAKDLFTYAAFVEKVIDADTLKVRFDLGFDQWRRETLRLRGIDAPEMDTKEGQAAKAFVQSYIKEAQRVIVHSSRSEKYGRYLADVFVPSLQSDQRKAMNASRRPKGEAGASSIPQGEESDPGTDIYLNNLLLEHGHAKRWE